MWSLWIKTSSWPCDNVQTFVFQWNNHLPWRCQIKDPFETHKRTSSALLDAEMLPLLSLWVTSTMQTWLANKWRPVCCDEVMGREQRSIYFPVRSKQAAPQPSPGICWFYLQTRRPQSRVEDNCGRRRCRKPNCCFLHEYSRLITKDMINNVSHLPLNKLHHPITKDSSAHDKH